MCTALKLVASLATPFAKYKKPTELRGLSWPKSRTLIAELRSVYPDEPEEGHRALLGLLFGNYPQGFPKTEEVTPSEILELLEQSVLRGHKSPLQFVRCSIKDRIRDWDLAKTKGAEGLSREVDTTDPLASLAALEAFSVLTGSQQEIIADYLRISRDIESNPARAEESAIETLAAFLGVKPKAAQKRLDRAREALSEALETFL